MLFLNNSLQLTELEAPHYHEIIVHTAMVYLPHATSALVVGGGDGYTMTELLKHKNLKHLLQVEIDQMVMDVSANFFPGINATYTNPRAKVFVQDVRTFLNTQVAMTDPPQYDVRLVRASNDRNLDNDRNLAFFFHLPPGHHH